MATRKEIHDEIAAAHERDKLATEIYDTGYNEGKNSNNAAWQQNMAAFADAQKRAAAQLDEQLDAANLTGAGSAAIDRVRKYRQSTPGQTANMGQTNPTVRAAAAEAASNKPMVSEDIMNEILNRKPFSYNPNADALYQQYKDQYLTAGNIAMKDTMGKAAALTGGYGNTYAQTVGQQVYDDYAARAADKIPELEQLAYERWAREGDELRNNYSLLYGREQDQAAADFEREKFEYQQSRDTVEDQKWASEFGLKADAQKWAQYMDERQMTLNEARFFLEQEIERGNLDIKKAQLALQKYETEQSVAQGWTKLDQSQQEINQGWTKIANDNAYNNAKLALERDDLNAHVNGSYYDTSKSGSGNTTTDKTLLQIFNNKQDNLDAAVDEAFNKLRNPSVTRDQLEDFLYYKYGEDVGLRILALAEQKSDEMNNDFRRR